MVLQTKVDVKDAMRWTAVNEKYSKWELEE
jgi:hypothetical protein